MERTSKLMKKKKAFSLVELVVVMAIIGILLVMMAPNYKGFIESAKNTAVQADARTLSTMLDLYEVKYGEVPAGTTVAGLGGGVLTESQEATNIIEFLQNLKEDSPLTGAQVSDLSRIVKEGMPETKPQP